MGEVEKAVGRTETKGNAIVLKATKKDQGKHGRKQKAKRNIKRFLVHKLREKGNTDHAGQKQAPGRRAQESIVLHNMQGDRQSH